MAGENRINKRKEKQATLFSMPCFHKEPPPTSQAEDVDLNDEVREHGEQMAVELGRVSKAIEKYQEDWCEKNDWLDVDKERGLMWCKVCRQDPHCKSIFATTGAKNFKTSALVDHASLRAHRDYGGEKGMLATLRSSVKGNMYRSIELRRSIEGEDLTRAVDFQKAFSTSLITSLKQRMEDQLILASLKILSPLNMPVRAKDIKLVGLDEMKKLQEFYGAQRRVGENLVHAVVDPEKLSREFMLFKWQASTEWLDMSFLDTWGMISCSATWKDKMPELLKIATIGLVQCASTAACERGFSRMNIIKNKFRNRMQNDGLDALLRITAEGPELKSFDFSTSIKSWKESAHYRHIFTGCPRDEGRFEEDNLFCDDGEEDMAEEL